MIVQFLSWLLWFHVAEVCMFPNTGPLASCLQQPWRPAPPPSVHPWWAKTNGRILIMTHLLFYFNYCGIHPQKSWIAPRLNKFPSMVRTFKRSMFLNFSQSVGLYNKLVNRLRCIVGFDLSASAGIVCNEWNKRWTNILFTVGGNCLNAWAAFGICEIHCMCVTLWCCIGLQEQWMHFQTPSNGHYNR